MSRTALIRSAIINVVGTLVVVWIGVQFGLQAALEPVVIGVVLWAIFEAIVRLRGFRIRIVRRGDIADFVSRDWYEEARKS